MDFFNFYLKKKYVLTKKDFLRLDVGLKLVKSSKLFYLTNILIFQLNVKHMMAVELVVVFVILLGEVIIAMDVAYVYI